MPVQPDPEASSVDRAVMELANNLELTGWPEEADELRVHAAYLRETWRGSSGDDLAKLHEALETIRDAAAGALRLIESTTPPPM